MVDRNMREFSLHPEYGLTDSIRRRAIYYVLVEGYTQKEAATICKVSQASVSYWIKNYIATRSTETDLLQQQGNTK